MDIKQAIALAASGQNLTELQAEAVMNIIMAGEATPAQIGALLIALRIKHETVEEIAGFARGMRQASLKVDLPDLDLIDIVGTGGDGSGTFNISTTSAFVVAGAGLKVAKHGNRFASSQCGSADVLEALGVKVNIAPDEVGRCIREVGMGFLFAQVHHQAMRHVAGPRREIGMRTVFNLLGPLTNPAGAAVQVVGVYDRTLTETMAAVLNRLGCQRAMVVHGSDGLDEITITGPTKVSELKDGKVNTYEISPSNFGIATAPIEGILGGDAVKNAAITQTILAGDKGPCRDTVLLNAAAAIYVGGAAESFSAAVGLAASSIDTGAALDKLQQLVRLTKTMGI